MTAGSTLAALGRTPTCAASAASRRDCETDVLDPPPSWSVMATWSVNHKAEVFSCSDTALPRGSTVLAAACAICCTAAVRATWPAGV